jgi:hypothetical protein
VKDGNINDKHHHHHHPHHTSLNMKDAVDDNLDKYSFSIEHELDENSVRTSAEMTGNTRKNKTKKLKSGIHIDTVSINPLLLKEHTMESRNFMEQYEEVKK